MFFPCGKVYHKMGIWWKKSTCMLWKKWVPIPQAVPIWWILLQFLMLWEIDRETHGYESNGKKAPILCEKYEYQFPRFSTYDGSCKIFPETNFPGFSHLMSFSAISYAMGKWWENPCISHMMKYTTGWESNRKDHSFYGKSVGTNFPGLSHLMGFADFSNAMGNLMRKPMHFPCNEVYHRMEI